MSTVTVELVSSVPRNTPILTTPAWLHLSRKQGPTFGAGSITRAFRREIKLQLSQLASRRYRLFVRGTSQSALCIAQNGFQAQPSRPVSPHATRLCWFLPHQHSGFPQQRGYTECLVSDICDR